GSVPPWSRLLRAVAHVDVGREVRRLRVRARLREAHRRRDRGSDLVVDRSEVGSGEEPAGDDAALEGLERGPRGANLLALVLGPGWGAGRPGGGRGGGGSCTGAGAAHRRGGGGPPPRPPSLGRRRSPCRPRRRPACHTPAHTPPGPSPRRGTRPASPRRSRCSR